MSSLRRGIRRLFSAVSGSVARVTAARGALAGLGLALLVGGSVQATEIEHGEAEQAPPGVVGDPAPATVAPAAPISPSRVVAHTAQLPKASPNATRRPLVAADLANDISKPVPVGGTTTLGASPAPKAKLAANKSPAVARRTRLPLAPSSAEIRREITARNGGPPTATSANPSAAGAAKEQPSTGNRLQQQATTPPQQNTRWPTHVDYTAGPGGPAGPNTAAERKGAMIESAGPQQGVIRNQW